MKLFNVNVQVRITELGPLEEPKPSVAESLGSDSPFKDVGKLMDSLKEQGIFTSVPSYVGLPGSEAMTMAENVKIAASSFEELQAVLTKFHHAAQSLNPFETAQNISATEERQR